MKSLVMAIFIAAGFSAQADLLTLTAGEKTIEKMVLNKSAVVTDANIQMSLVGAGLRAKTVLFVPTKVYVTELFSSEPAKFSRDAAALKSLEQAQAVAIRLTFVRNVDAPTVASSYREALVTNSVALNDPSIAAFLTAVEKGGDASQGKSFVMLMVAAADGSTELYYEDTKAQQTKIVGDRSLQQKILSIWLGTPADSGLKTLKESLLKPVY